MFLFFVISRSIRSLRLPLISLGRNFAVVSLTASPVDRGREGNRQSRDNYRYVVVVNTVRQFTTLWRPSGDDTGGGGGDAGGHGKHQKYSIEYRRLAFNSLSPFDCTFPLRRID